MPRHTMTFLASIILAAVSGTSQGQTIYDDGETHTVNGPSGPIEVLVSRTTLNIVSPASITGTFLDPTYEYTSVYGGLGTTINLEGGQVVAQGTSLAGIISDSAFTATGGSVSGGYSGLISNYFTQISGGTFTGGEYGAITQSTFTGLNTVISISGGTFQGGGANVGPGTGLEVSLGGEAIGSITGGNFIGVSHDSQIGVALRGYPVIRTIRKLMPFQEVRTLRPSGSMHQCARHTLPTSVTASGP
jgi:hypothetical protein